MKFSVIIPVYNSEKYLRDCIESVLNQTYGEYEIVIVNDGSTDHSLDVCREYSRKHDNVKVINKDNGGQSSARNVGLKNSVGEYIVFLDSDDRIVDRDFFSKISAITETNKTDIIAFKYIELYEDLGKAKPLNVNLSECRCESYVDTLKNLIKRDAFYCSAWSKCVRRELLTDNGITFDERSRCEDMDWYFGVIEKANSIAILDDFIIEYRRRSGSVTTTTNIKNLSDYVAFLDKWDEILSQSTEDIHEVLKYAFAKLYVNLTVAYSRCKDRNKKGLYKTIKNHKRLLKYDLNPVVKKFGKISKIFGFGLTLFLLKIYSKVK